MDRLADLIEDKVREDDGEFVCRFRVVDPEALAHALEFYLILYPERGPPFADRLECVGEIAALIGVRRGADDRELQQIARDDQVTCRAADAQGRLGTDAAGAVRAELAAQSFLAVAALRLLRLEALKYRAHALRDCSHVNFMALQILMFSFYTRRSLVHFVTSL
jgi:hypothetical protein